MKVLEAFVMREVARPGPVHDRGHQARSRRRSPADVARLRGALHDNPDAILAGLFPAWPDAAETHKYLRQGTYPWAG